MIWEYWYSFEIKGERIRKQLNCLNIHEVIKKTRKEYPEAHTFIVLNKTEVINEHRR